MKVDRCCALFCSWVLKSDGQCVSVTHMCSVLWPCKYMLSSTFLNSSVSRWVMKKQIVKMSFYRHYLILKCFFYSVIIRDTKTLGFNFHWDKSMTDLSLQSIIWHLEHFVLNDTLPCISWFLLCDYSFSWDI